MIHTGTVELAAVNNLAVGTMMMAAAKPPGDARGGRGRLKDGPAAQEQLDSIQEYQGKLKPARQASEGEKTKEAIRSTEKSKQRMKNKLKRFDEDEWKDE